METKELIKQTNNAFEFIQKLYFETSYLIKEIQGLLREEEEKFIIGRPSGYGISSRSSVGLEQDNVRLWLLRKFAVFFVPEEFSNKNGGQTITNINKDLRVIYIRIILNDSDIKQPKLYSGVLASIKSKKDNWKKFEKLMGHFEYNDNKIFNNFNKIDYEDSYIKIKGKLLENNLYEINNSNTIIKKVVNPTVELYRNADFR